MLNRRQFLNDMVRGGIFASLTLLSGILIRRWGKAGECQRGLTCGNCKLSDQCSLPEAEKYRAYRPGSKNNRNEDGRNRK